MKRQSGCTSCVDVLKADMDDVFVVNWFNNMNNMNKGLDRTINSFLPTLNLKYERTDAL